jgi:hypothetical protein
VPLSTASRRKQPGKDQQADRTLIVTIVTVIVRVAGQVLQVWIKRGGL